MCTASWLFLGQHRGAGAFELLFNRDESRQRRRALPPRRQRGEGVSYLAPTDADAGGTWIAVNEFGLAIGLLNLYSGKENTARAAAHGSEFRSRGLLVADLIPARSQSEAAARLTAALRSGASEPAEYRPFRLLALSPGIAPMLFTWDGATLEREEDPRRPLASSSYDPEGIEAVRRREWGELVGERPQSSRLLAFHRSHHPERGPLSPCMHRPDASTVSFTRVRVEAAAVSISYSDGPPCRSPLGAVLRLPRRVEDVVDRHAGVA